MNVTAFSTLTTEHCCNCGTPFGIEMTLHAAFRADPKKRFYCPNGHELHYSESTETWLRRQLEETERRVTEFACEVADQRNAKHEERKQKRRAITMLHNHRVRAKNGVCPCCNRSFTQLRRHMKTKHPHYLEMSGKELK